MAHKIHPRVPGKIVAHDESEPFPTDRLNHLRSAQIHKNPPEFRICPCVRGLFYTFAKTLRHRAPLALQQLPLEDDSLLLRGFAKQNLVSVPRSAVEVVDVNRRLVGRLPRGEYSTGSFPTTAVDPVAIQAEQGPTQRKHDRAQRLEPNRNPRGASVKSVSVLDESGQGK